MKFGLQRIESMLGQSQPSFELSGQSPEASNISVTPLPDETVKPFHAQTVPSLALPKTKPVSFSSHRHATNPDLAISLLKEIEATVVGWQLELEQVILQIQAVYAEGPIVEGWLESQSQDSSSPQGAAALRHVEVEKLMDYVESICNGSHQNSATQATQTVEDSTRTGYRLCGLDADGQLWSRPCPTQQVPYVSLAIARYQKLRILLNNKQALENRLNQLIQSLTVLTGQLQKA
jgi:hypothetical protein